MNRYSKIAKEPQYVYVKMTLNPGAISFDPIVLHFLYDGKAKCVKYSSDGMTKNELVIKDFQEEVDIDGMFTCGPAPFVVYEVPHYSVSIKSSDRKRRIAFEAVDEVMKYYKPYKWVIDLFEDNCEDEDGMPTLTPFIVKLLSEKARKYKVKYFNLDDDIPEELK